MVCCVQPIELSVRMNILFHFESKPFCGKSSLIIKFQWHFLLFRHRLDNSKTPVIAQRRIIVQNPDGTTKVIVQNVLQSSQVLN